MKIAELSALPAGTRLVTSRGDVVTYESLTTADWDGRRRTVASVEMESGRGILLLPRSIRGLAPARYPEIASQREDLAEAGHTITVERVDRETARAWTGVVRDWRALIGRRAVVERSGGRLVKVCAIAGVDGLGDDEITLAAEGTASLYGARYIPAAGS